MSLRKTFTLRFREGMRSQFQLLCLGDINGPADKFYDVGGLVQHRMADNVEVLDGSFRKNNTLVHVKIGFPMFAFFSGFQDAIPILRMKSLFRNSALGVSSSGLLPKIRRISGDTVTTPRCNIKLPAARFLIVLAILGLAVGLLGSRRRSRKLLAEAEAASALHARNDEWTNELEKANEDLQRAQAELQRRWQYLAEAQRLSHSGTFGRKVSSGELVWSDETYSILGFARETNPTLDLVVDRVHPDDLVRVRQLSDRAAQNGMDLDVEHRILLPDGVVKHVHAVAHAGTDSSGNLEYMGVVTDITERKRAEEERQALSRNLQESKTRLEEAQRVAHMGHYYWDLIANRVIWSDELYRIYGLTPREGPIDMAMVSEMIHPDDRDHVLKR